jgi:hypothetical protein
MGRWCEALAVGAVVVGACGGPDQPGNPHDAAVDASYAYSISGGAPAVAANTLLPVTIAITGYPNDAVIVTLDRASAGTIAVPTVTLDASGNGSVSYTPCSGYVAGCIGPATLSLALTSDPGNVVATDAFMVEVSSTVGEVTPCQTNSNVMYLHGNDYILDGTVQLGGVATWSAQTTPGRIAFEVGGAGGYHGRFSLAELQQALAAGVYTDVQRETFAMAGHPGLEVMSPGRGCNQIGGRFQVHDYTADPAVGTVYSVTISFEQLCDQLTAAPPRLLQGCFHYEAPMPTPVTPPAPDPTKLAVRVLSTTMDGSVDTTAIAVFTDASGTLVYDTVVDQYGMAQAALPNGGAVTTIQFAGGYEVLHTYRGVGNGQYIVVNPKAPSKGAQSLMGASYTTPANATSVALVRACNGGTGSGPGRATLEFYDGCRTSTFGVLALASFVSGPMQFVWLPSVPHLANGFFSVPATWAPFGTATVTFTNVPSNSPSLGAQWFAMLDGVPYQIDTAGITTPTAGTQSVSVSYPPNAGHGTMVTAAIGGNPYGGLTFESRSIVDTGTPSAVSFDLASQPIPLPSAMQQTTTGASWSQTASGTADVRRLIWQATTPTVRVRWFVVEPYNGQASTTLSLPAAYAAQDPTTVTSLQLNGTAVFYDDYDTVAGFTLAPPTGNYRMHSAIAETYAMHFPF